MYLNGQTIGFCLKPQKGITTLMILGVTETKHLSKQEKKKGRIKVFSLI